MSYGSDSDPYMLDRMRRDAGKEPIARKSAVEFAGAAGAEIAATVTERGKVYARPEDNFARIAEFWSMWLLWRYGVAIDITAADVGVMQAGIKIARQAESPEHRDTALDAAAYLLLAAGCAT